MKQKSGWKRPVTGRSARWQALGLTRRFVVFGIKDALLLSEENAVLEIGVMKKSGPPIPLQALFRDRVIGGTTSERSPAA